MEQDTIAGIASGMGGGIGIIRVSGNESLDIVGKIFRTPKYIKNMENHQNDSMKKNVPSENWTEDFFRNKDTHTIHYGYIVDQDKIVDEVMVLLMKAPASYTKEDVVEIDCHGGPYVVRVVLECVVKAGARLAEAGEFTKRAFLNGRIDLSQAEAVMEVISSENQFALDSAVHQLEGRVSNYIEEIRQNILHDMGFIEAALDDPEHISLDGYPEQLGKTVDQEIQKLKGLLDRFDNGRMKSEGINTVIVGKPNAGKSSLMNLLLDEERAIVTNVAGTTRDTLEERVRLGDVILNLVDTAGIHNTDDLVESVGVEKAVSKVEEADFIIYVVDSHDCLDEADEKIISLIKNKEGIILLNKSDLEQNISTEALQEKLDWNIIPFSNETKLGLRELEDYIMKSFLHGDMKYNNQVYLTSIRHKNAVEQAVQSLQQVRQSISDGMPEDFYTIDLMDAYKKLGLINGETASEDLVNKIFHDFCMGK